MAGIPMSLLARLALTNPEQLATIAAAKGLLPPPMPGGGAPQNIDMMAAQAMPATAPQPAVPPTPAGPAAAGMPMPQGDIGQAMGALQPPSSGVPQPLPPMGVPIGGAQMNMQALLQQILQQSQQAQVPSIGQMMLGG